MSKLEFLLHQSFGLWERKVVCSVARQKVQFIFEIRKPISSEAFTSHFSRTIVLDSARKKIWICIISIFWKQLIERRGFDLLNKKLKTALYWEFKENNMIKARWKSIKSIIQLLECLVSIFIDWTVTLEWFSDLIPIYIPWSIRKIWE